MEFYDFEITICRRFYIDELVETINNNIAEYLEEQFNCDIDAILLEDKEKFAHAVLQKAFEHWEI